MHANVFYSKAFSLLLYSNKTKQNKKSTTKLILQLTNRPLPTFSKH